MIRGILRRIQSGINVDSKSEQVMVRRLQNLAGPGLEEALKGELLVFAEVIRARSEAYTPVASGDLVSTLHISTPSHGAEEIRVRIAYAGAMDRYSHEHGRFVSEYVLAVHERLDTKHLTGGAKFLERAVNEIAPELEHRYAEAVSVSLMKGGLF